MQIQIKISVGLYTAVFILFIDDLLAQNIKEICVIKFDARKNPGDKDEWNPSLDSEMIINCFEREDIK